MYKVKESFETSKTLMRDACCQGLLDAAEKNPDVVVLDADLVNSSRSRTPSDASRPAACATRS